MSFEEYHQQCLGKLVQATEQLQVSVTDEQLAKIAELIVQTMTGPWRYFHTPKHIFMVGGQEDAIEVLAALFHDVVYVQVDQSVNFNLSYYIAPFIRQSCEQLVIRETAELPRDSMFEMVADVFGFVPGQVLSPFTGQNEFLSALVAAKVYESFLDRGLILQVIACIEATIPFRSKSPSGLSAIEQLYQRFQAANEKFEVGLTETEIIQGIQRAVRLANRDVSSFADPSSARFLDGTWSLLPETNHHFDSPNSYSVHDYRVALQKMEGFMNFLNPELVFQQFKGEPDDLTYHKLVARAKKNIAIARLYLGSKLFTIAFLEALSLRLGKQIPLAMMMGELPSLSLSVDKLEDSLPNISHSHTLKTDIEQEVFTLLEFGRCETSKYDLNNSPLTTFMIKFLGFEEVQKLGDQSKQFFQGNLAAEDFLDQCNEQTVKVVIDGILKVFDSRKAALLKVSSPQVLVQN